MLLYNLNSVLMIHIKYLLLFFFINFSYSQNFEGEVTYKTTLVNPNPDLYDEIDFKEKIVRPTFGKQGFMIQKCFYKGNKFMGILISNFESSFELYAQESKKLYRWKKDAKKGTVLKVNESSYEDTLVRIIETNEVASIVNIRCKKTIFEFKKNGKVELWYNPDCLKVNKENFKDFKYDLKNILYEKLGCLPFRIKVGFINSEIIEINEKQISDELFKKPDLEYEMQK